MSVTITLLLQLIVAFALGMGVAILVLAKRFKLQKEAEILRLEQKFQTQQHENALRVQEQSLLLERAIVQYREEQTHSKKLQEGIDRLSQIIAAEQTKYAALASRTEQEKINLTEQVALLQQTRGDLVKEFENLAGKIFEAKQAQFTQSSKSTLDLTLNPLKQQLNDFRKKVEDVYEKENAERNRLAGQVIELQKQAQKIGQDAVNLAQALKGNTKSQGNWGEVILERLLEDSGLRKGHEYSTQVNLKNEDGSRFIPDVVIHLPENKNIVIDAKCSLVHYEKFCSAEDEAERKQFLQAHIQSIRHHVKSLSIKDYERLAGLKSLDFVFIFVPIEAAFMVALQEDPSLYREAYDRNIILVSPTTLLATLRTVDNIWRYEKQNKNAEKIADAAGALYDQLCLSVESFKVLGEALDKTQVAYKKAVDRFFEGRGNTLRRAETMRLLGAKTKKRLSADMLERAGIDESSLGEGVAEEKNVAGSTNTQPNEEINFVENDEM